MELTQGFTPESYRRALALLDAAIALDPNYARAYGLKAIVVLIYTNRLSRSADELARGRAEALRNARKAVELAPDLPIGHGALAEIYRSELKIEAAAEQYRRVNQLAGGDPDELRSYAAFQAAMGRTDEALRLADRAISLDPLDPWSYGTRALVLLADRRYAEVVRSAEVLKRQSSNLYDFPVVLGDSLIMLGRFDEARRALAEENPDDPIRLASEAVLAARAGDRATAVAIKTKLEQLYGEAASYQYALILASLGETDQAIAALERAWQIKDPGLLGMKIDSFLDPVRTDPRFAALLDKMDFPT